MSLPWNGNQFPINPLSPVVQTSGTFAGSQLIRVKGLDSAKAYPTSPNSTIALFEENDDVMYIKSTDASNFPTIRKFRFTEEPIEIPNSVQYVTLDEFRKFKEELLNAKQFVRQPTDNDSKWNSEYPKQSNSANKQSHENGEKQ